MKRHLTLGTIWPCDHTLNHAPKVLSISLVVGTQQNGLGMGGHHTAVKRLWMRRDFSRNSSCKWLWLLLQNRCLVTRLTSHLLLFSCKGQLRYGWFFFMVKQNSFRPVIPAAPTITIAGALQPTTATMKQGADHLSLLPMATWQASDLYKHDIEEDWGRSLRTMATPPTMSCLPVANGVTQAGYPAGGY